MFQVHVDSEDFGLSLLTCWSGHSSCQSRVVFIYSWMCISVVVQSCFTLIVHWISDISIFIFASVSHAFAQGNLVRFCMLGSTVFQSVTTAKVLLFKQKGKKKQISYLYTALGDRFINSIDCFSMKNNTTLWPWKHLPKNRTVHDEISSRCPPMRRCCPSRRCPSSTFARISHCKQAFMAAIQEAFCFRLLRLLDFAMWAVLWPVGFVMLVQGSLVFVFCDGTSPGNWTVTRVLCGLCL